MTDDSKAEARARMARRRQVIEAAREAFDQLEERSQVVLAYEMQVAEDEGRMVSRYGRTDLRRVAG